MTKSEYMGILRDRLADFRQELQQEIIGDYERHFAEGEAAGKSEEEIAAELGSVEDMIRELSEAESERETAPGQSGERYPSDLREDGGEGCPAVSIDGLLADVFLKHSEDGRIHVEYQNNGSRSAQGIYRFYQYEENGVFCAGVKGLPSSGLAGLLGHGKITLDVWVPQEIREIQVNTSSGDVKMQELTTEGTVRVNTASGDISGGLVRGKCLNFSSASGDIELETADAEDMKLQTASGDIECTRMYGYEVNLLTASGDIELGEVQAEKLTMRAASGDICGRRVGGRSVEADTASGDVELTVEAGERFVRAATISGDVALNLCALEGADVEIRSKCGECVIYRGKDREKQKARGGVCAVTVGFGECRVEVETVSGDVEVRCGNA